ncbi:hypothetical protein DPMN_126369 [Dreissena polymorpha]|uniref:Uncharacterized protein n=1 Tax=Dreissena polymorpha TaxID=45954 RepID=A0A9D4GX68_DREPO|nr:hypothetical protein DPMN_126369 [Dreissena polymorpha]
MGSHKRDGDLPWVGTGSLFTAASSRQWYTAGEVLPQWPQDTRAVHSGMLHCQGRGSGHVHTGRSGMWQGRSHGTLRMHYSSRLGQGKCQVAMWEETLKTS